MLRATCNSFMRLRNLIFNVLQQLMTQCCWAGPNRLDTWRREPRNICDRYESSTNRSNRPSRRDQEPNQAFISNQFSSPGYHGHLPFAHPCTQASHNIQAGLVASILRTALRPWRWKM